MNDQHSSINTYKIIRELGHGSMGVVYEARDCDNDTLVALKMLSIPAGVDTKSADNMIRRMQREARIVAQLNHPNIVHLYDSGKLNDQPFIAMELCQGTTLADYLKFEKGIPVEKVKHIALQLLSALDTAHEAGIVHRDIKPQNIMLLRDGSVKLMDFGVAKWESDPGLTQSGQLLGTPAYMSPEQILGKDIDNRSDLFSFAAVMCECLSGEKAFAGENAAAIVNQVTCSEPYMLDSLPVPWNGILRKALEKDPQQRYQDASEMMDDITKGISPVLQASDITNEPHTHPKYLQKNPDPYDIPSKEPSAWEYFWYNLKNRHSYHYHRYLYTDKDIQPKIDDRYIYAFAVTLISVIVIISMLYPDTETKNGHTYSLYRPPDTISSWIIALIIFTVVVLVFLIFKFMHKVNR